MSMTTKSLGFGSILALFVANVLVFAGGPRAASAGGLDCGELCYCFGDVCNEEEFGFDECVPGFTPNPDPGPGEPSMLLDQIFENGQPTGVVCGEAT